MGQCLTKLQKGKTQEEAVKDPFPDHYTESKICDYYVDRLPPRLLGEGIHLLRGGPGPIVCSWTHELLNDAGVHSYQDRELLLKTRDEIVAAVETHRQRLRAQHQQQQPAASSRPASCDGRSRTHVAHATGGSSDHQNHPGQLSRSGSANSASSAGAASASGPEPPEAATPADAAAAAAEQPPLDKAAQRQAAAAEAAAAAAAAADATATATAFSSDGDGTAFRLTRDWLPSGLNLYRISEERMRHMASSGLASSDPSVHPKGAAAAAAAVAMAATLDGSVSTNRGSVTRSRLATVASGDADGLIANDGDGERDNGDGATAAPSVDLPSTPAAVGDGPVLGSTPRSAAATETTIRAAVTAIPVADSAGGGSGCRCDSSSSGSGSGGSGGEDSGSSDSRSPGSTLGAESLSALTSLEPPATPSAAPSPVVPSLLAADSVGVGGAVDATCAVAGSGAAAVLMARAGRGGCGGCDGGGCGACGASCAQRSRAPEREELRAGAGAGAVEAAAVGQQHEQQQQQEHQQLVQAAA